MRRRTLPPIAPLYIFVITYPIMWALGLAYFVWPLGALFFGLPLLMNRPVRVPPGFGLWLMFLVWMLLSGSQGRHLTATGPVRLARHHLPHRHARVPMGVQPAKGCAERSLRDRADGAVVVGGRARGIAGVLAPSLSWHSFAQSIVPKRILSDPTGYAFIHPALTDVKFRALGHPLGRPKALFAYTNQWGAAVGVLTPFVIAAIATARRGLKRSLLIALLAASVIPIVISLNRGLWLALIGAVLYVAWRLMRQGNARLLLQVLAVLAVVAVALVASPLRSVLHERVSSKTNSNQTRVAIYSETVAQVKGSPIFGFGSPRPTTSDILTGAHIGTQGQVYLVLFSHGVPGLLFFLGFFFSVFRRSRRGDLNISSLWNIVLVIAAVEMWFYDFIPTVFFVIMIAAAWPAERPLPATMRLLQQLSARIWCRPQPGRPLDGADGCDRLVGTGRCR